MEGGESVSVSGFWRALQEATAGGTKSSRITSLAEMSSVMILDRINFGL